MVTGKLKLLVVTAEFLEVMHWFHKVLTQKIFLLQKCEVYKFEQEIVLFWSVSRLYSVAKKAMTRLMCSVKLLDCRFVIILACAIVLIFLSNYCVL